MSIKEFLFGKDEPIACLYGPPPGLDDKPIEKEQPAAKPKQQDGDTGNMFFSAVTYKLYPEDAKIANSLEGDERVDFIQKCKKEGRYTRVYDE